ncbi:SRPBCC family protein [Saccharopolyspora sp. NFXS83]|uniref:SRPBCC family protein n=1 Tax=Saccharopolyspora sp. NFXS83 TaxID=2993560 RepID=UPI00224AB235|nr:SRPBCC family protein [Saccharopolyspora sp. NFXS83]MCX2730813.1 SRPBCC family protein [Saccharopolyspora sp. NFXS83]
MSAAEPAHEFQQGVDAIWRTISSFERYEWGAGVEPGFVEEARCGNEVGSIRAFQYYGAPGRQRLTTHSDADRTYSWESLEPYEDLRYYLQTIAVRPFDGDRSLMTWSVEFDAPETSVEQWRSFFREEFAKSFEKLEGILAISTR